MSELPAVDKTGLEVISPDNARRFVFLSVSPFCIGRGESGIISSLPTAASPVNVPRLSPRRLVVSRRPGPPPRRLCEWKANRSLRIEGRRHHSFGIEDSYEIIFRSAGATLPFRTFSAVSRTFPVPLFSRRPPQTESAPGSHNALHSQLPLDSVLGTMLDHAISITDADRGILLEPDSSGALRIRLARRSGGLRLSLDSLAPSQTALRQALERQASVITEDLAQADIKLQDAQSIVAQRLRAIVAIPLYTMPRANSTESIVHSKRGEFSASSIWIPAAPPLSPNSSAKSWTRWRSKPPASWTTRAWSNTNVSGNDWSRNSASPATFSRPFSPAASGISLISPSAALIFRASLSEGTISMCFR